MNFKIINMNKDISNTLLSLSAIIALSACSTNDDYKTRNNDIKEEKQVYIDKGGLKGRVLLDTYIKNANVCFDKNKNAKCDKNEVQEKTFEGGKFSFSKEVSVKNKDNILISEIIDNEKRLLLSANQNESNLNELIISGFSTLIVNEQMFNPYVDFDKNKSLSYLLDNVSILSNEYFTNLDYIKNSNSEIIKISGNIRKSLILSFNNEKPFSGIASYVDELSKKNKFVLTNIPKLEQKRLDQSFYLKDLNLEQSWDKSHSDEQIIGASASSSKIISYSKWHNKLTILDISKKDEKAKILQNDKYLDVLGARDQVDAITGASEQELKKVEISSSGNKIYSLVTKYDSDSKNIGIGIYSSSLNPKLTNVQFASKSISSNDYFNYPRIKDMKLSKDNTILIAGGDDKKILKFAANDLSNELLNVSVQYRVKKLEISDDNKYVFVSFSSRNNNVFAIYDANLNLVSEIKIEDYYKHDSGVESHISSIAIKNKNELYLSIEGSNKILNINISDKNSIIVINEINTSANITSIKMSKDSKYLIASLYSKQVNIIDINEDNKIANLTLSTNILNAFDLEDNKFAIAYGRNINYFKLFDGVIILSPLEKQQWSNTHRKKQ